MGILSIFSLGFAAGETEAQGWEGASFSTYSGWWQCWVRPQPPECQPSAVSTFLKPVSPRLTLTMLLLSGNGGISANPLAIPARTQEILMS